VSHVSGTVVDSSFLLDVFTMDTASGDWSQGQLTRAAQRGALILNAVAVAEIAPRFERIETLRAVLPSMAVIEEIRSPRHFSPATRTPITDGRVARAKLFSPTS
jgi:hypothetical protein